MSKTMIKYVKTLERKAFQCIYIDFVASKDYSKCDSVDCSQLRVLGCSTHMKSLCKKTCVKCK